MPSVPSSVLQRETADFVVVGAGYAGLTAALRLREHGTVVVLEARDRVGGRVYTKTLPDGTWLDFGGTWLGPGQDDAYRLARELGVETYPTYDEGDALVVLEDGKIVRNAGGAPLSALGPAAVSLAVLAELESMAGQVPLDAPWTAPRAREWDRLTVAGWLDSQTELLGKGLLSAVSTMMEGLFCSDPAEISLLHALFLIRTQDGFVRLTSVQGGDQQDRIRGGAQAIAEKIHARLGEAVRLGSPVRQICQDATGVEAVADTVVVRAKRAIVAIPPVLSGHIRYEPRLPAERALLVERLPNGSVIKVLVAYEEPFWRAEGLSGQSMAVADPVGATYDGCTVAGKPGLMIAFAFGRQARSLARQSPESRRRVFLDALVQRFGPRAATPVEGGYHELDWADEPWSGGGMWAHWPPGVITNFGPSLREPFGRIHWAGTETAVHFNGSISGAIESGERAAREVTAAPP